MKLVLVIVSLKYVYSVKDEWKKVYDKLKDNGYSIRKISALIGSDFSNQLYENKGLRIDCFERLEKLYGSKIRYKQIMSKGENKQIGIKIIQNKEFAELIGIILGDGCISEKTVLITQNGVDNREYVNYIRNLTKRALKLEPKFYDKKDSKAVDLKIHRKSLVNELIKMGIKPGDKTRNQTGVPEWIREKSEFEIACAKGLIDTDGSIYRVKRDGYINIEFKNESQPLLDFIVQFCKKLGIGYTRGKNVVYIRSQNDVRRFIDIVKPEKSKYVDLNL